MNIFKTKRLIIRPFTPSDFEKYAKLDSNPKVMECMGLSIRSLDEISKKFDSILAYYKEYPQWGIWATELLDDRSFIGWTCLKHLDEVEDIEVGYRYLPEYWGKGYATEAAQGAIEYGFERLGLGKIVAVTTEGNVGSQKVLDKLGMRYLEIRRYYGFDVRYYELLKSAGN